jgi:hypothetical protein
MIKVRDTSYQIMAHFTVSATALALASAVIAVETSFRVFFIPIPL